MGEPAEDRVRAAIDEPWLPRGRDRGRARVDCGNSLLDLDSAHLFHTSELEPFAAGDPQLERGENHGEDAERDPHRAGVAVATASAAVERSEVDDGREDLARVVRAALAWGH